MGCTSGTAEPQPDLQPGPAEEEDAPEQANREIERAEPLDTPDPTAHAAPETDVGEASADPPRPPTDADRVGTYAAEVPEGARIEVFELPVDRAPLCESPEDLLLRYFRGGRLIDEHRFESSCRGACTEEQREEGREKVREIKAEIREGEGNRSLLDYNYTDCIVLEHSALRRVDALGRLVLLVESDRLGPHDVKEQVGRLVTVGCDEIHVSDSFRNPWTHGSLFDPSATRVRSTSDAPPWRAFEIEMRNPFEKSDAGESRHVPAYEGSFETESLCGWTLREVDQQ